MTHATVLFFVYTLTTALEVFRRELNDGSHDSIFSVNRHQTRFIIQIALLLITTLLTDSHSTTGPV